MYPWTFVSILQNFVPNFILCCQIWKWFSSSSTFFRSLLYISKESSCFLVSRIITRSSDSCKTHSLYYMLWKSYSTDLIHNFEFENQLLNSNQYHARRFSSCYLTLTFIPPLLTITQFRELFIYEVFWRFEILDNVKVFVAHVCGIDCEREVVEKQHVHDLKSGY